ncbi:MAG TPA: methylaspartate ammonia-lyase [Solirubrobacterales bacterium]|nr:methylaspartate ammonia-lyase [Solirubrobacterales bacterium]
MSVERGGRVGHAALRVVDLVALPIEAGFFFDDQAAIKAGAKKDGFVYLGSPRTEGFSAIRQPATAVAVFLRLSDGFLAHGDCVSVQYGGVGGREPPPDPQALVTLFEGEVAAALRGAPVETFREFLGPLERFGEEFDGFGAAGGYGLSQAWLSAVAHARGTTMADVVRDEWKVAGEHRPVPILAQSGDERTSNVDKMILKRVEVMPHGLINDQALVGKDGDALVSYVRWVRDRVHALNDDPNYAPTLHFDVYGLLGTVADRDVDRVADIVVRMTEAARPFRLRVEQPLHGDSRAEQIEQMRDLREALESKRCDAELVADEWANTLEDIQAFNRAEAAQMVQIKMPDLGPIHNSVEAILDCRRQGVLAYLAGSCCETDCSARVSVHVAVGAGADQMVAKPGMGVDEGLSIVRNEIAYALRFGVAGPSAEKQGAGASGGHY